MGECYFACKEIVQLCDEVRMKGKNVIRIRKIVAIADRAILADDSAPNESKEFDGTGATNYTVTDDGQTSFSVNLSDCNKGRV